MGKFTEFMQNTRARNLLILVVVVIFIVVLIGFFVLRPERPASVGGAKVAKVPGEVNYEPGSGKLSKEYLKTLLQAEQIASQSALKSGGSAIPSVIQSNEGTVSAGSVFTSSTGSSQQSICQSCCNARPTISDVLSTYVQQGQVTPLVAAQLSKLQDEQVSPDDYASKLSDFVKAGKLTQSQSSQLFSTYQYEKNIASSAVASVNEWVADSLGRGDITPATASSLRTAVGSASTANEFNDSVQNLVKQQQLTSVQASAIIKVYCHEIGASSGASSPTNNLVGQMLSQGRISPDVANQLKQLASKNVSVAAYQAALNEMVKSGQLTPAQATALLNNYKREHGAAVVANSTDGILNQLTQDGKISSDVANKIRKLIDENPCAGDLAADLGTYVNDGSLTSAQSNQILEAYRQQQAGHSVAKEHSHMLETLNQAGQLSSSVYSELRDLRASGVPSSQYATRLTLLVKNKQLSSEAAQKLLTSYKAEHCNTSVASNLSPKLAQLERSQQQDELKTQERLLRQQAQTQKEQAVMQTAANNAEAVKGLAQSMNAQGHALISAWNAVPQEFIKGSSESAGKAGAKDASSGGSSSNASASSAPLQKAGDITFAVLDTAVNSDQPGPVMATIVSGRLKGGRLLGGLSQTPDGERVVLKFTMLSMPNWNTSISTNAVAINPDTARTAIASDVDHHYLSRYGSIFAASFVQGYANAVESSGQTTVQDSGASKTTNPDLTTRDKLLVGLGEVGKSVHDAVKKNFNRKPTVRVDAGVGLGILFMSPVKAPQ